MLIAVRCAEPRRVIDEVCCPLISYKGDVMMVGRVKLLLANCVVLLLILLLLLVVVMLLCIDRLGLEDGSRAL